MVRTGHSKQQSHLVDDLELLLLQPQLILELSFQLQNTQRLINGSENSHDQINKLKFNVRNTATQQPNHTRSLTAQASMRCGSHLMRPIQK
jgi:hypothetical protein